MNATTSNGRSRMHSQLGTAAGVITVWLVLWQRIDLATVLSGGVVTAAVWWGARLPGLPGGLR